MEIANLQGKVNLIEALCKIGSKTIQYEQETHAKTLKTHEVEVSALKKRFDESLQQTLNVMCRVLDLVVSHTK